MRITASHIVDWVNTNAREVQAELPRLIRRLCGAAGPATQIAFPAGDSVYVPGWDGVLDVDHGNAWVPVGKSFWEIGCDKNVDAKAGRDYRKRTDSADVAVRSITCFVFVTPRRWLKKAEWIARHVALKEWADVRVVDADDLEQWLEQSPSVALQFAEELGLSGTGVVSLDRYWAAWSQQCVPAITPQALFVDRGRASDAVVARLKEVGSTNPGARLTVVRADSSEEAVAFSVAAAIESGWSDRGLVVTSEEGWRFVEKNPQIQMVIDACPEAPMRPALAWPALVLIGRAIGNRQAASQVDEIVLERPGIYEYEKALLSIGMEESDAKRYAATTGRSWSIFRRQKALDPSIRNPGWLAAAQSGSLPLLCLLGAWHSGKEADRQAVQRLAARSYEDVEKDLRYLAGLDDAPVLSIGMVWMAKSPLELLLQFGGQITSDQLDRFFAIAKEMLEIPDPQLELPESERWMAQVHGKVHAYSGHLFESVCDALVKLAVRGVEHQGLQGLNIETRVSGFVDSLLRGADSRRWLSLSSHLPTLAEAAPDTFLDAVRDSFRLPGTPVLQLLHETGDSGLMGSCWHSGLLWALELLAWNPRRLLPVALILAELSRVPLKGNWGNKPSASLQGLFRAWLPQTAEGIDGRIDALNMLVGRYPDVGADLLLALVDVRSQFATPANRPKWREDDAGAGRGVSRKEYATMVSHAKGKLLEMSVGNPKLISSVLTQTEFRRKNSISKVLALVEPYAADGQDDESREILRAGLRQIIHWHRNYDQAPPDKLNEWLVPVEELYEKVAPADLIARHLWLFSSAWVDLPVRTRDEDLQLRDSLTHDYRQSALKEIYVSEGISGVERLVRACGNSWVVGGALAGSELKGSVQPDWVVSVVSSERAESKFTHFMGGYIHSMDGGISDFMSAVVEAGRKFGWGSEDVARFLCLGVFGEATWRLVESLGSDVYLSYWKSVSARPRMRDEDPIYPMSRFLEQKRPVSALHCAEFVLKKVDHEMLYEALHMWATAGEEGGPRLDSWHLENMVDALEGSGRIDRDRLIRLEFSIAPALGYEHESKLVSLFDGLAREPSLMHDLISLLYPSDTDEPGRVEDASTAVKQNVWRILRACKIVPGTRPDLTVDREALFLFVEELRRLGRDSGRLHACEEVLGEVLAHAPADIDEQWPCTTVCELLDHDDLEEVRRGFYIGVQNKRGPTWRLPTDGGGQERTLAGYFRAQASRVQHSYPNVARVLSEIARSYEHHGRHEDVQAGLTKEGF